MAILGWLAIAGQLYLILINRQAAVPETIIRFFSYFTVLSNIFVAVCCTALLVNPAHRFFSRASTQASLVLYIAVVGLVYNTVLRFLWTPEGLQWAVDELLHAVMPALYIIYWIIYSPKKDLAWKQLPGWMVYPLAYMAYTIIHGAISGFYPYPFIDVVQLGYPAALRNAAAILLLFVAAAAGIMAVGRFWARRPVA
jgi:hypothetical protein